MIFRLLQFRAVLAVSMAAVSFPAFCQSPTQSQPAAADKQQQQQSPYQGTVVEDIVARVNDQIISRSDYERAVQDLDQQARQQGWSQPQILEQKHELLRNLIDQQLLISKGKELGITGENELVRRLDEIRKQNHLESLEDLQKAAESQGVSYEDFKANIRNNIITSQVIRDEVGRHISISPSELERYYEEHKQEFDRPEQVHLSEILIPTANPDDSAEVAAAQKKADDLEAQLKSGANFAALAKAESKGPTAAQGGDLGDFRRGQLAKVLEDQTFNLNAGQFTAPIRTKQGFVILKVTQHTPGGLQPFKNVQDQIEEQVGMQKMNPALRQYLTRLREEAYINIKDGYEDSGASSNELKPVYSAYQPPTPRQKKHVTRTRYRGRPAARHRSAPPAVPSLAQVPQADDSAPAAAPATAAAGTAPAPAKSSRQKNTQVAKSTEKPGKKEKIRFGQAPRETLPAGTTRSEDAGATSATAASTPASDSTSPAQEAANVAPDIEADGAQHVAGASEQKTRFSARASIKKDKAKKSRDADPFAPPPESTDELATREEQSTALGLNGDTTKKKKKDAKKPETGQKTRFSDEGRKDRKASQQEPAQNAAPAADQQPQSASPDQQPTTAPAAPAAPTQGP